MKLVSEFKKNLEKEMNDFSKDVKID